MSQCTSSIQYYLLWYFHTKKNNSDLARIRNLPIVLHSNKFIKLSNFLVYILEITSKGALDSAHKQLLGRLSNHLVDALLHSMLEGVLDRMSKAVPKLFHSRIIAKTEIIKD